MKTIKLLDINGNTLFEHEESNNTIKRTVETAIKAGVDLERINLCGADLTNITLENVNLTKADFTGADLSWAVISHVKCKNALFTDATLVASTISNSFFSGASFNKALLINSQFHSTRLRYACFTMAQLGGALFKFCGCDHSTFNNVDLRAVRFLKTDLDQVDFSKAEYAPYIPLACPSCGAFIGWKTIRDHKLQHSYLVQLLIPEDAKRCSAASNKCRCDKAKVLSIENLQTHKLINSVTNKNQLHVLTYKVGEMVYPDEFDDNRWNECSHGIHFFINKQEAINYYNV